MTSQGLENLVKTGGLKPEPPDKTEFDGLVGSARARLQDAANPALSLESRFDLAYNAGHALALAALRWHGYRPSSRYVVFQCIPHTLGLGAEVWRVLSLGHERRNKAEYEGVVDVDGRLVEDLVEAGGRVFEAVSRLGELG